MAIIEPTRRDVEHPSKFKRYSSSLRLWHWVNLIAISGSLITVLINSTLTDRKIAGALIKSELGKAGTVVTDEQVRPAVHALSDSVWGIHIYFGYVLAALLAFRLILEFFQLADQKFIRKIKSAYYQFNTIKKEREAARHELVVKGIYGIFYLLLIIMVVTGLFLAFEDALAAYKSIRHSVKEVHGFCMYLIIAFIVVHIIGVLLAERKDGKGIVSDMINGGSEN
ncbi:cytochrome b/b6 domain-containing protein [Mucilaginibacter psychrotolerans]|uniref:Cytochrome b/b6 domain-containing protein n=1 Tax=Mucilaginibacter psychrotolerans TaxID=1524096 RepID=A0A4Y8SBP6_9SPHI|nr:cytochrome b/b6 domain-containing protein [Mucilaginibacter psychrotolerans]TFF36388.1 cytochrome b/b6 domain-containing protein [Mucilaginibacter psychrotolerans]